MLDSMFKSPEPHFYRLVCSVLQKTICLRYAAKKKQGQHFFFFVKQCRQQLTGVRSLSVVYCARELGIHCIHSKIAFQKLPDLK